MGNFRISQVLQGALPVATGPTCFGWLFWQEKY